MVSLQATILGLRVQKPERPSPPPAPRYEVSPSERTRRAEIFTDGSSLFVLALKQAPARRRVRVAESGIAEEFVEEAAPSEITLWLHYIGRDPDPISLRKLERSINTAFGVKLHPFYYRSSRFDELKNEGRQTVPPPSKEDLQAAELLSDRAVRTVLVAIKSGAGMLVRDLGKPLPTTARSRVEEIREALQRHGLVETEIVVICSRTQTQTARVSSLAVLNELAGKGLRCACGKPATDEPVEEALTITDRARALIDGSRWLSLLVVRELQRLGIPADQILLEHHAGGDEMDCLANISGELALFELKDKEFNLGEAYSFGAKLGIVRPRHPVIVTTEHVGGDAREHFERAGISRSSIRRPGDYIYEPDVPEEIHYIEGVDNLRQGLESLTSAIFTSDAAMILDEILPLASIDSASLLQFIDPEAVGSPTSSASIKRVSRARSVRSRQRRAKGK